MCDYSLQSVRSRPAKIGGQLITKKFGAFTRGFAWLDDLDTAVCVLPGTELAFARDVRHADLLFVSAMKDWFTGPPNSPQRTAIFRQINKDVKSTHHDALEFPDGQVVPSADFDRRMTTASDAKRPSASVGVPRPDRRLSRARGTWSETMKVEAARLREGAAG
jgi:hypothetical protein